MVKSSGDFKDKIENYFDDFSPTYNQTMGQK